MKKWFGILLIVGLIAAFSGCSGDKSGLPAAADFTLSDGNGNTFTLSDAKGDMVILNFWATWCPPCQREIPDFIDLYAEYGDRGLTIVGVSLDQQGWPVVDKYIKSKNINYPIVMGTAKVVQDYGSFKSIPTTFILDKKGRIVKTVTGYRPRSFWEEQINTIL